MAGTSLLIIVSAAPYGGSDAAWNALRLARTALNNGSPVKVFLINEGVDAGRKGACLGHSFDLAQMLKEAVAAGAEVKYCKTCIDRCGIGGGEMIDEISAGSMEILYGWIMGSEKAVTF